MSAIKHFKSPPCVNIHDVDCDETSCVADVVRCWVDQVANDVVQEDDWVEDDADEGVPHEHAVNDGSLKQILFLNMKTHIKSFSLFF